MLKNIILGTVLLLSSLELYAEAVIVTCASEHLSAISARERNKWAYINGYIEDSVYQYLEKTHKYIIFNKFAPTDSSAENISNLKKQGECNENDPQGLIQAIIDDDVDVVKAKLVFTDVNTKWDHGMRPIHIAITKGNYDIILAIVNAFADLSLSDDRGRAPLHLAAMQSNIEILDLIYKYSKSVDILDNNGKTPLFYAIEKNQVDISHRLLIYGASLDVKEFIIGEYPIHIAARKSLEQIVLLIKYGAEIDKIRQLDGMTALHIAIGKNNISVVEYLLNLGINVNQSTYKNNAITPLHLAVKESSVEMVKLLLSKGANPNIQDVYYGETPLHYAAKRQPENIEIIKLLLNAGADKKIKSYGNDTPADSATQAQNVSAASILKY